MMIRRLLSIQEYRLSVLKGDGFTRNHAKPLRTLRKLRQNLKGAC